MENMLTHSDVENIIKEKGDCGIQGDKLRKIIDFFLTIILKIRILLLNKKVP